MPTLTSTATASSARPAPSRNSPARPTQLAGWLLIAGLLAGCGGTPQQLPADNPALQLTAEVLLYKGAPYTGTTFELSPAGDTLALRPYQAGRLHGLARQWYGPGRPQEQRHYAAGREEGLAEGWWPDGSPRFRRNFRAGQYEGLVEEWYENGRPERRGHYAHGQEAGAQQLWLPDGTLRANYDARNGRQYGFIGTKHCASDSLP
ncbi:toxin-antitoxin system YwqK family antitoxin [Hymenobacter psychrophilus]|uniref:MORN repeat variant n=1 Tax=Hymenobacter psychrophilus TaxID=651662 RepID=A0A1H3LB03_9BACT|nr:membrane-binding protein [Hymenobacter psychrophilus]SDY61571.1 hypothetical protein SAMN04488069_110180 [Hymenobacter psychrophilus]